MRTDTPVSEFRFTFEELPIVQENGFSAGLLNGQANIHYWREDGYVQVFVREIYLEGFKATTAQERAADSKLGPYHRRMVEVEDGSPLYLMIFGVLDGEWEGLIEDRARGLLDEAA